MPIDSRFNRLPQQEQKTVTIYVEGNPVTANEGESVAAAVLKAGVRPTRTTATSGSGRAPYCMMGVCFECLMEINGKPNIQACMTEVHEGMNVAVQAGARRVPGSDL